ncbi:MAG: histidine triad nucleotide-binding protein [Dehalococcoidia bacterium]|nr:MAG: histidine triad nucleotide-binding protein [Dehalococcoidia bacterium]
MSEQCVFCRIISGEIPGDFVYRDDEIVAFRDINPVASTHVLVVPRQHIESVQTLRQEQEGLVARMILRAKVLAEEEGIADRGYRLVLNSGPDGGQVVPHLHLHLIGGRRLADRMG